ncbi:MAG: tRNA (N(6)-L-threonylcarbamoyladenosine(37)-C(2))-methylthiotransferase MtaB, partial [Nitrospira sp.]|nr:tRNA (N(6)-L-threonylcarbamoyladenosine(37)-C(2))-methylthiotransferase MtaB [Nitrospira sp.]
LRNNDHQIVDKNGDPDVVIVNTCTVTARSDHESRQMVRKALKSGAKVIATGCYAQIRPEELTEIKGLDLIVGNSGKQDIIDYLNNFNTQGGEKCEHASVCVDKPANILKFQPYFSKRSRAFLKVQDGCNFACTYCAVPKARGKSRSLGIEDVLKAVDELSLQGFREIVMTGIHIGTYGLDLKPKSSLLKLMDMITQGHPDIRIRLSSIEPQELSDRLLALIKERNICSHLHIPLQSGSDRILKLMNRRYTRGFYQQLINKIITEMPDIAIGTDIITGFPGESENDFNETVKFIAQLPLSYIHIFPYSKRPGTKALLIGDHVTEKEKKNRVKKLMKISSNKKKAYMSKNSGRVLDVIVEKRDVTTGYYNAISDNYLRVFVKAVGLKSRSHVKVRAKAILETGLLAEPLN